jgi:hypothetical protein
LKVPLAQSRTVHSTPSAAAHALPSAQCTVHTASRSPQTGPHVLDASALPWPYLHDQVHWYRKPTWAVFMLRNTQRTCRFPLADGCCDGAEANRSWRDATTRSDSPAVPRSDQRMQAHRTPKRLSSLSFQVRARLMRQSRQAIPATAHKVKVSATMFTQTLLRRRRRERRRKRMRSSSKR